MHRLMPPLPLRPPVPAPPIWLGLSILVAQLVLLRLAPIALGLLPFVGIAAIALAFHRLLAVLGVAQRERWTMALVALPSVTLVAVGPAPIDSFHMAACILALAMAIQHRHVAMFSCYAIAVAIAPDALLVAPLFIAIGIRRRIHPGHWPILVPPLLLAGWQSVSALPIAIFGGEITRGAPNIWAVATTFAPEHAAMLPGLALAAALGVAAAFVARMQVAPLDNAGLVGMASLAILVTAGLLPRMTAHAFLLSGTLLFALAIARRDRRTATAAALAQFGLLAASFGAPLLVAGSVCMIAATWLALRPLLAMPANDNPDVARIPPQLGLHGTLSYDINRTYPIPGKWGVE